MALQKAINRVQKFWSKDGKSKYGHAGIITSRHGNTYEARWMVGPSKLWENYGDQDLLIVRHNAMNPRTFRKGIMITYRAYHNDFYPFYRLVFHMFPPLAKLNTGKAVCSELCCRMLYEVEMFPYYNGATPDNLHDHVCWGIKEGEWSIVFEQRRIQSGFTHKIERIH